MNYLTALLAFVLSAFIVVKAIVFIVEWRIPTQSGITEVLKERGVLNPPPGAGDAE